MLFSLLKAWNKINIRLAVGGILKDNLIVQAAAFKDTYVNCKLSHLDYGYWPARMYSCPLTVNIATCKPENWEDLLHSCRSEDDCAAFKDILISAPFPKIHAKA